MKIDRFLVCVLLVCIARFAVADGTIGGHQNAVNSAREARDGTIRRHKNANDRLNEMIDDVKSKVSSLEGIENHMENPGGDLWKTVRKFFEGKSMGSELETALQNVETQRETAEGLWQDVLDAQIAYENAIGGLNHHYSPEEQRTTEDPEKPHVKSLYPCQGPCSTPFETEALSKYSHEVYCDQAPHKGSGYKYYSCPPDYGGCPLASVHTENLDMLACRGPCGKPVPNLYGIPDDVSHTTTCPEKSWHSEPVRIKGEDLTKKVVKSCPQGEYYHCNIDLSCPNAANHVGSDETVTEKYIDSNGNEVPNPATPLACGHAVGSKGIHLRVSCEFCSEQFYFCAEGLGHGMARCPRNESGETCTVSGGRMILCADPPHVHQYPSDPKQTQADTSPTSESHTPKNDGKTNKPDGKTPKQTGASKEMVLAACGVHTIEKGSSSAHSHREVSCRLDGYGNACDPGSYYVCQEDEHRHQYPNTPKGFRKVIVCPAHAWTGCKGTKSHAETCPAGHSYYTCNKAATAAHEAHTASDAPSSPPQQNPDPNNEGGDSSEGVRVCGHPKSMGGDHTFVSSCSTTNADGESCQRTSGYWTCKGHTHKFPNGDSKANTNKDGDSSEGVRKCGHPKSASGDHTFVSSCSATNANGDACQRTSGYWPCKGHTHKFPEPEARRKCGHLKSASGDHSFIASCPATNANGDTCQRTSGYWPCKGQHTHKFPESSSSSSSSSSSASSSANNNNDDDSDDASDDDSDDADENLVKCGRPKCGSMVSSASAHKSTCGRGHSYWSCKPEAVAAHLNH